MANIPGEIVWQANDNTWFTNNAAEVYPAGITIYHVDGRYKFTDGVTTLGALPFRGDGGTETQNLQDVTDNGANTTNQMQINGVNVATVNDIPSLSGYVDTAGLTTNYIPKATASDTIGDSSIIDDGTTVAINKTPQNFAKLEVNGGAALQGAYITTQGQIGVNITETSGIANKSEVSTGIAFRGNITNANGVGLDIEYTPTSTKLLKSYGNGNLDVLGTIKNSALTPSQIVVTDASKNLASLNAIKSYSVISTYFSNDFTTLANLNDFSITNPNSTWALSGGYFRLTRPDAAAGFSDFANYNGFGSVNSKYWSRSMEFFIKRLDATSYGIGFGFIADCVNSATDNVRADLNCSTAGTKGTLSLRVDGVIVTATTKLTFNLNDKVKITITRNKNRFTATAQNCTTIMTTAPVAEFTTITSRLTSTGWSPTQLKPQIYNLGGTYDVITDTMGSKNWLRPDIIFDGDSITHGMFTDRESLAYPELIGEITGKKTLNFASSATTTADSLNSTGEIIAHAPRYVYLMKGRNDLATGISQATILANFATIIGRYVAAGIDYRIISVLPSNGIAGITSLNTALQAAYPTKFIDIYSYLNNGGNIKGQFDSGDGTHLWEAGHQEIAKRIIDLETTLQQTIN